MKRVCTFLQATDLHNGESISNTKCAGLEGRSVDPASPLSLDSAVVIKGLKGAPQHSGKEGRLIQFLPDEHRWVVQLDGEEQPFKIKEENLEPLRSSSRGEEVLSKDGGAAEHGDDLLASEGHGSYEQIKKAEEALASNSVAAKQTDEVARVAV